MRDRRPASFDLAPQSQDELDLPDRLSGRPGDHLGAAPVSARVQMAA